MGRHSGDIIEGASEGAGSGHDFLRHIDRCRPLLHLVDAAGSEGRDPTTTLRRSTLSLPATASFWQRVRRSLLPTRPTPVLSDDREPVEKIRKVRRGARLPVCGAVRGDQPGRQGADESDAARAAAAPPVFIYEPEFVEVEEKAATENDWTIERRRRIRCHRCMAGQDHGLVNIDDYESRQYKGPYAPVCRHFTPSWRKWASRRALRS